MYFKIYGVTLFCLNITIMISSAVSQITTQITLKSTQEIPGLVNYTFFSLLPYSKQLGWYFFSPRIRFGTCKVRPSESTVELNSLGRPN